MRAHVLSVSWEVVGLPMPDKAQRVVPEINATLLVCPACAFPLNPLAVEDCLRPHFVCTRCAGLWFLIGARLLSCAASEKHVTKPR